MSNTRYLEIDSTFRDRNLWPKAGEFEIPISQSGRKDRYSAVDPVSLGVPINTWTSNRFKNDVILGSAVTLTISSGTISNSSSDTTFVAQIDSGEIQTAENYYVGAIIKTTGPPVEITRITGYKFLYTDTTIGPPHRDYVQFTVATALSDSLITGFSAFTITDPTVISTTTSVPSHFFVPDGLIGSNAYYDCYLYNETLNSYRKIIDYDTKTHLLQVDETITLTGWTVNDNYSIRKEVPTAITETGTTNTRTQVVLNSGVTTDDAYNGQFIRVRPQRYISGSGGEGAGGLTYEIPAPQGEIRRIVDYDGATRTATVTPPFSTAIPQSATPQDDPVGGTENLELEILDFSYDNLNPFVYNGSLVSQQEMVCYEIELLNLVLPNETLKSTNGSRISFYPYVYVELRNVSGAGAGKKNMIYSNNPNSTRAMFRAAVDDVANPIVASFIKIDSDGCVQTVKFKPNDNLYFAVTLPDGTIYETTLDEKFSPYAPEPRIQVSALFSLKRL